MDGTCHKGPDHPVTARRDSDSARPTWTPCTGASASTAPGRRAGSTGECAGNPCRRNPTPSRSPTPTARVLGTHRSWFCGHCARWWGRLAERPHRTTTRTDHAAEDPDCTAAPASWPTVHCYRSEDHRPVSAVNDLWSDLRKTIIPIFSEN